MIKEGKIIQKMAESIGDDDLRKMSDMLFDGELQNLYEYLGFKLKKDDKKKENEADDAEEDFAKELFPLTTQQQVDQLHYDDDDDDDEIELKGFFVFLYFSLKIQKFIII